MPRGGVIMVYEISIMYVTEKENNLKNTELQTMNEQSYF